MTRNEKKNPSLSVGVVQDKRWDVDFEQLLEWAIENRLGRVEFKYELKADPDGMWRNRGGKRLRQLAERHNIALSVHAPYDDVNFGTEDPAVLRRSHERMQACLAFSNVIDARHVTMHGGFFLTDPAVVAENEAEDGSERVLRPGASPEALEALKRRVFASVRDVVKTAKLLGVPIALENVHDFTYDKVRFPVTVDDLRQCLVALDGDIGVVFDSGHAHSIGVDVLQFVEEIGAKHIVGTHIHDNDGLTDDHLAPGDGTVDFESFFAAYRERGWRFPLNLEIREQASVVRGRDRVVDMLSAETPAARGR